MKEIYIITGIISFFFGIFALVFIVFLPLTGIYFGYNSHGTSMEPTLKNPVTIRLSPKWAPFEDLQAGDIILFRQEYKLENNGVPGVVYVPKFNKDHTKLQFDRQTEIEKESLQKIYVMHRIIALNKNSLITKGDNNETRDFFSVKPDEYQGKIVWHMNHINCLFKVMYRYGLWLGCTILFYIMSFLRDKNAFDVHPRNCSRMH